MRRLLKPLVFLLCLVPLALIAGDLALGRIRGEWVKEITHRTGFWGLVFITLTLAVTPLRRWSGWNALQGYRRMLGLFGFTCIAIHFAIYLFLDRQIVVPSESFVTLDGFAVREIAGDVAKRPYITVGFTGLVLMVPLALTSTRGWIRRLGRRWVRLHSLVYLVALAGVVHFTWSVKADLTVPTRFAAVIVVLLAARLLPGGRRAAAARVPRAAQETASP